MPIYAYRCATCGHAQDVLQKISDPLLTVCPSCGAGTYEKQVTAAGFQLKGSGWYVTDFRDGNKAGAKKEAGPEGGQAGGKADAAADAPAATTATQSAAAPKTEGAAPASAPAAAPAAASTAPGSPSAAAS